VRWRAGSFKPHAADVRLTLKKRKGTGMIAVIFEVWPEAERRNQYFDLAAALRPELERIDGFISIERFKASRSQARFCRCRFGAMMMRSRAGAGTPSTAMRKSRDAVACSATTDYGLPQSCAITGCIRARTRHGTLFRSSFPLPEWQWSPPRRIIRERRRETSQISSAAPCPQGYEPMSVMRNVSATVGLSSEFRVVGVPRHADA
jgi:hypothetical protein